VEALVLLVGDAGMALPGRSPVLAAVARDVERWAPQLPEARTAVAYLGDLVYPDGVRPPGHPQHGVDTLRLHAQLSPLLGPGARMAGVRGWFLDGNHDWGQMSGPRGLARLRQAEAVVRRWAAAGHPVRMAPRPGTPGPEIVELGERHRLLFVGTHAWLGADAATRRDARRLLGTALQETSRSVTVLAHHPLMSAGEHGSDPPVGSDLGLRALASRAGLVRQDMTSRPYRDLVADVREAAEAAPPMVWAAGHDHSLQLLRGSRSGEPRWTVVSGSASKLDALGRTPELVAGGAWPGYARLFLLRDGRVQLQLVAAPVDATTTAEFRTVLSRILDRSTP
jgi:hypothetical protein